MFCCGALPFSPFRSPFIPAPGCQMCSGRLLLLGGCVLWGAEAADHAACCVGCPPPLPLPKLSRGGCRGSQPGLQHRQRAAVSYYNKHSHSRCSSQAHAAWPGGAAGADPTSRITCWRALRTTANRGSAARCSSGSWDGRRIPLRRCQSRGRCGCRARAPVRASARACGAEAQIAATVLHGRCRRLPRSGAKHSTMVPVAGPTLIGFGRADF